MGEFNVNKSDGSLDPTAGMPETYPATQVMMSDGVTSVEDKIGNVRMTKLWENPNPSASFATQDINLSTDDYDMILVLTRFHPTINRCVSSIVNKGEDAYINCSGISAGTSFYTMYRSIAYVNNTKLRAFDGYIAFTTTNVDNERLIPYRIYGIKLT